MAEKEKAWQPNHLVDEIPPHLQADFATRAAKAATKASDIPHDGSELVADAGEIKPKAKKK